MQEPPSGTVVTFTGTRRLARAAQLLVALSTIFHVGEAAYAIATARKAGELGIVTPTQCSVTGWFLLIDLPACIVFCSWWFLVAMNLRALHATELRYSPAAAVWAFFIPLLNIFLPPRVGQEIWKASD